MLGDLVRFCEEGHLFRRDEGLEWVSGNQSEKGPEATLHSIQFHLETLLLISKDFCSVTCSWHDGGYHPVQGLLIPHGIGLGRGTKCRSSQVSWLIASSSERRKRGRRGREGIMPGRGARAGLQRQQAWPRQCQLLFPALQSFGGGGEGGREGVLGGDLGQSSLPKPLPTWVLKEAAVF